MALVLILLICVLIMFSAFFSASEITYAKAIRFRIDKAAEEGSKVAKLEQYICDHYVRTLSAVLVGNNLVNIAASSAGTMLFVRVLQLKNGAAIATAVITALLLLFGETLPKIVAASMADTLARLFAYPLKVVMKVFSPIVFVVEKLVGKLSPLWTPKEETPDVTTEELVELLDNIEDEGVFTEKEGELIKSAIEITDTMAMEVLTPRVDLLAIDLDELAVKVAAENTEKNGLSNVVRVAHGDLLVKREEKADVIVANIIADVICYLCGPVKKHLLEGGTFICSGIIREREEDVQRALAAAGYTVCNRLAKGEWVCLAAKLAA